MRFFITLSKRSLAIILSIVIIGFILVSQVFSQKASRIDGSTNEIRVQYLKSLKLDVDDSNVTSKDITIPQKFNKVYENYNALQKKSGFDLSKYKGKPATVYTYKLSGTEKLLHLIVCNSIIIGGDIADVNINGEMKPLYTY